MDNEGFTENETGVEEESNNNDSDNSVAFSLRYNVIMTLVIIAAVTYIFTFRAFVTERIIISGDSMFPSFQNENVVFIKKYDNDYQRYDVIVIRENRKTVIKRIIGMPNETIKIKEDGCVYINDKLLEDDIGYPTSIYGCLEQEFVIGENEYFVMGDNRDHSLDSRVWGAIDEKQIKGEVFVRVFPYWKFEIYN